MNYLGLKFPLPKPATPVETRELTVSINGASRVFLLPGSAMLSDEFIFAETDNYSVTLVDIDEYGNRSAPSAALHGAVCDDLKPATPGELGPIVLANKRHLTESEAAKAKEEFAKKQADAAKALALKAQQDAEKVEKAEKEEKAAKEAKELAAKPTKSAPK
jgi:hypothetical protein